MGCDREAAFPAAPPQLMIGHVGGEEEEKEEKKVKKEEEEENHTTSHSGSGPMLRWGLAMLRSSSMSVPPMTDKLAFSCIGNAGERRRIRSKRKIIQPPTGVSGRIACKIQARNRFFKAV